MPLSAIYPRHFGIATHQVLGWIRNGADDRAIRHDVEAFAVTLPSVQQSYEQAQADAARCSFNDHDPGWQGMLGELPPKKTKSERKLLFARKRAGPEAEAAVIQVSSSDDDQDGPPEEKKETQEEEEDSASDFGEPTYHFRSQEFGWGLSFHHMWFLQLSDSCGYVTFGNSCLTVLSIAAPFPFLLMSRHVVRGFSANSALLIAQAMVVSSLCARPLGRWRVVA